MIINPKTQEEFNQVLEKAEKEECLWSDGEKPTEHKGYYKDRICLFIEEQCITFGSLGYAKKHNEITISAQEYLGKTKAGTLTGKTVSSKEVMPIREYKQGDILVTKMGEKRKILGICGEVYFISDINHFEYASGETKQELDDYGYKLKPKENRRAVSKRLQRVLNAKTLLKKEGYIIKKS